MMQGPNIIGEDLVRPKEAAALIGIGRTTLMAWERKGYITSLRTPSGQRLFRRDEVLRLIQPANREGVA